MYIYVYKFSAPYVTLNLEGMLRQVYLWNPRAAIKVAFHLLQGWGEPPRAELPFLASLPTWTISISIIIMGISTSTPILLLHDHKPPPVIGQSFGKNMLKSGDPGCPAWLEEWASKGFPSFTFLKAFSTLLMGTWESAKVSSYHTSGHSVQIYNWLFLSDTMHPDARTPLNHIFKRKCLKSTKHSFSLENWITAD